jgi:hypothetical protein
MSALGQKQTCAVQKGMSALPPKADMCSATRHVRFVPKADSCSAANKISIRSLRPQCCSSIRVRQAWSIAYQPSPARFFAMSNFSTAKSESLRSTLRNSFKTIGKLISYSFLRAKISASVLRAWTTRRSGLSKAWQRLKKCKLLKR